MIFIPINVNGVNLNFLLDSGVQETILFSLEDENITLQNVEKIKLVGFGSSEYVEGLKSIGNKVVINNKFEDFNHEIYIILDEDFNISSSVGIPVNGIIGYHFFKNFPVEIDYLKKKIVIYKYETFTKKKIKDFQKFKISLEKSKPYLVSNFMIDTTTYNSKLLIDTGNSDALWMFKNRLKSFDYTTIFNDDYLGRGFSGEIFGNRVRLESFKIDNIEFKRPYVAIPDTISIKNLHLVENRIGSIGAEIIKRFTTILDYKNEAVYFKKNYKFKAPFTYNSSGLEIHHKGLQWIEERVSLKSKKSTAAELNFRPATSDYLYKFKLRPIFIISSIRKDSPAELSGLKKNDILILINNKKAHEFSLQQINDILRSEGQKKITFEVQRGTSRLKFTFYLKSIP